MAKATNANGGLEVHTHSFVSGPRSGGHYEGGTWQTGRFSHSHVGGETAHQHAHTGPSVYTIDKDDWFHSTGLRGGGRKVLTAKPSGEQMAIVELEDWQKTFTVVLCDPTPSKGELGYMGEGPGEALPVRLVRQFRIGFTIEDATTKEPA